MKISSSRYVVAALAAFMSIQQAAADTVTCTSKTATCNGGTSINGIRKLVAQNGVDSSSCPNTDACNGFKTAAGGSATCKAFDFGTWLGAANLHLSGVQVVGWFGDSDFVACEIIEDTAGKCTCS